MHVELFGGFTRKPQASLSGDKPAPNPCTQPAHRHAMMALKAARSMGKNRAHIFDPDVDESRQQHRLDYVQWNTWLHQALEDGGLQPWYQGIRDNNTGQINKYEVLARRLQLIAAGINHTTAR